MKKEKILITSALPYANGPLHFGHIAGAYLPADIYARFERLKGSDVFYVCGTDEYGVAITLSAEQAGRTPKEHVDHFHTVIKKLFLYINLSFDHFSRTTNAYHKEPVQRYFLELLNNGYIEEKVTDQLWSEEDQRFLADRYVVGLCPECGFENARGDECQKCGAAYEATDLINPRSKLTGSPLQPKATKHWFLLLDRFRDQLLRWLEEKQWKPNVANFVKEYISNLRPRAITRDSNWGIPVPLEGSEGKVLYVWFDAPIGYISATMEWAEKQGDLDLWRSWWCDEATKLVQFIGKDNIPFHGAIFPAMTMGQKEPIQLVQELPANEFLHLEGRQFSKSDGWYIDLETFFQSYTADQIRYCLAANAPETSDAEFTWSDFQQRCNQDLVGKLGNFINRTLVFAKKRFDGKVPFLGALDEEDEKFLKDCDLLVRQVEESYQTFRCRRACRLIMELAQKANMYFDHKAPWKDAKDPDKQQRMATTIHLCIRASIRLALVSSPVMPTAAQKMWELLGQKGEISNQLWSDVASVELKTGLQLAQPEVVFQKVEDEQIANEIARLKTRL